MGGEFSISKIIQFQQVSQYLAANNRSFLTQLQSGSFVGILPNLLYMEGYLLQNLNTLNPGYSTLRGTGEYVLSLCGKYLLQAQQILNNLSGAAISVTGPANQSVLVGATATFSVSVTGTAPFQYQWLLNGVVIPGATNPTYLVTNAQLSQSGNLYSVQVTNPVGRVTSTQATLTVTASLVGFLYYSSNNPGPTLQSNSDPFVYQSNFPITHNSPFSIIISSAAANNQYLVVKAPSGESAKSIWFNTNLNSGNIPDAIFENAITFGGFTYYYTRVATSLDPTQPLVLS